MDYVVVPPDHPDLIKFDEELRQLINTNGYISQRAVERLHAAGCGTIAMFYMMGSADDPALSQRNLGRSSSTGNHFDGKFLMNGAWLTVFYDLSRME